MIELATEITEVVVYTDRARVTRHGSVTLEPGVHTLQISDLTFWLNPDSVRASAKGSAGAKLLGVQVQRAYYEETPAQQIKELEDQIEALQDELREMKTQEERIKQSQDNLVALSKQTDTYALALASGEQSIADQLTMFDKLRARIVKFDTEISTTSKKRREKERQLDKLKKELEQWHGTSHREAYHALIEVEVHSAGDMNVDLVYVVTGAGWQPLYDLRFSHEQDQAALEITYLAQITQHTGENWQDIALTLSTARPALTSVLPELEPWFIRPMSPRIPSEPRKVAPMMLREAAAPPPDLERTRPAAMEVEYAQASVESSGATVTYRLPTTISVPADGSPHKATVTIIGLKADVNYVAAPKQVESVFRCAKMNNDSVYTLLPGPANLYAGDEYIGTTELELIPPQGEIELYLGVEDRLKVVREFIRRDVDKKIVSGRRRIFFGYEIKLENYLPEHAQVTIHDHIPVARHEDIRVKLEFADPKPTTHENMNQLSWELSINANEDRNIRFVFSVDFPQSMEVIGLP